MPETFGVLTGLRKCLPMQAMVSCTCTFGAHWRLLLVRRARVIRSSAYVYWLRFFWR